MSSGTPAKMIHGSDTSAYAVFVWRGRDFERTSVGRAAHVPLVIGQHDTSAALIEEFEAEDSRLLGDTSELCDLI